MKFSLFVHMERSDLAKPHSELLAELEELVVMAEQAGFETAWIGEHHGMEFTISPNPFINIAHLAAKTKTIRLGTGTIIAPFWHPIKLAGEAAMTDVVTGGRLDLGIARGAYSYEYQRVFPGLDAWGAGQRMREMIPAIRGLWDGDYEHAGEFWQFPPTTSSPKPVQQPYPPIWVAARDPNSHDFAVANKCQVQVTPLASGDGEVASLMERFNAACQAHPDIARPQIMLLMHTFVAEDAADADRLTRDLSQFYCQFGAWFQNKKPVRQGVLEPLTEDEIGAMPQYAPDKIRQNLVIGEADEVIGRLKTYEAQGYDQYSIWIDSGLTHERKKKSLQLFIDKVMPAFQEAGVR
ncbi:MULTISPECIES: LLM class flavin-dependent oxidoreductase [unclassified Mesorhizobium]|jgi:alkanesulfonate monooxygenase SsuD/methylene tetrahydromethanopterin reductase-like flavin-dependent oxidoreductase (luciferase family)|uniref:LLM class flavin-dependent oxidoreductase n=1 Tax=unclassified Mesorhizobium TaxID=325217 RepID=UPI000FE3B0F1|nr:MULTISPECIES: LLM class flavin-dependent oxidoreductase [unclassified Mesorhizobium]MDG4893456.1 LLM class flavin-dependent oxidoreductase [Mesorhizobium sp. WSM4976]RWH73617.1 MAG: LLM class flavin-dependent oxidoreductase [Mesorhizobium sp.]RWL31256.1 MAG: LLM class flavin-dependent oxidoreductase [Mesorhizobium sp.]RWL36682.1 MAG: LLM class flavin-dependent oxidoreductase [Mesorhizobium sp.]RWL40558.1 MAG: LLM class flavin-dependent oxidoreductase [Mesorhizobium sp.]